MLEPIDFRKLIEEYQISLWQLDKRIAVLSCRPMSPATRRRLALLRTQRLELMRDIAAMRSRLDLSGVCRDIRQERIRQAEA